MIAPNKPNPTTTLLDYYERIYKPRRLAGRAEGSDQQYRISHVCRSVRRPWHGNSASRAFVAQGHCGLHRPVVPAREPRGGAAAAAERRDTPTGQRDELLDVLLSEFAQWMVDDGTSKVHARQVRAQVRTVIRELGIGRVSELDGATIRDYFTERVQAGLRPRTAVNYRKFMVKFLRYLVLERGIYGPAMTALAVLRGQGGAA